MSGQKRRNGRTLAEFVFTVQIAEVAHLLDISRQLKPRRDQEVVNRASVVFLMAVWQTYVETVADSAIAKMAGLPGTSSIRLSTPSAKKIDQLFEQHLGINAVSQYWRWRGMTADRARLKLEQILKLRHQVAHKARTKTPVKRDIVLEYVHFVHRLAVCLHKATAPYLTRQGGVRSPRMRYRGVIGKLS